MATNESLVFSGKSIVGPSSVVIGATTFPQTTLQATGTTTLLGNVFVQGGALYPPGPMTAASTTLSGYAYGNGTYIASAPEQSGSGSFQVWYPFDNSITTSTESAGVYSTSSPYAYSNTTPYAFSNTIDAGTTTTYNGVWHQLQMPSAIVLEYYTIFPRAGQETARSPATWRVFGSNDGTNWYTLDAQSGVTSWSAPQVSKTYYLSPLPASYTYFRLSVQNVNGSSGGILDVAQWNLYGKPPVPAMSILGGDVSIASGGGLNVGPGTLGSNVVVFSNVSGGSNVFVMDSKGRVTIGSTTQTGGSLLSFGYPNSTNKIITLWDGNAGDNPVTATNFNGFGINNNLIRYQVNSLTNWHAFFGASTEYARITSTGLGVLTGAAPTSNLQVTGNAYVSNAMTTTNVFATSVVPVYPISFRNRIINGDFIIDQRNSGASSTPGTGKTQVIDRWKVEIAGTGRCLVGQNLLGVVSPTGFTSYYGMQVSTTTTVNAGDYFFFGQVIEGINVVDLAWGTASAKPVTLSFWAYSSITGTGGGFVRNAGESAGNYTRSYPFTYTINATNTWEYKTVVIPGDTSGQWLSGQLDGVEVGFIMWNGTSFQGTPGVWAGTNYTGPSGGTIGYAGSLNSRLLITGVQFEAGLNASQFERRHLGFELAQCQRYYEPTIVRVGGYHTAGNFLRGSVYFNVKKRPKASPTLSVGTQYENNNLGILNFDNSNFDQSSARWLSNVVATGDAYGQWKVSVDCEF
jgi:hypothetical protein